MLSQFLNRCIISYEEIRGFKGGYFCIKLKDGARTIRQKLQRMGTKQMKALWEEVDKLLKARFIYLVDTIEWVSPVVVTPKKDGRQRVCIDFKPLNISTKKNPYPLPFVDEILDTIVEYERYYVFDRFSCYFQLNDVDTKVRYLQLKKYRH